MTSTRLSRYLWYPREPVSRRAGRAPRFWTKCESFRWITCWLNLRAATWTSSEIFAALMNYLLAYFSNEAQADTQATSALQIRRTGEKVNIATHVTVSKGVPTVVGKVTMERSLSQALAEFTGNSKRPFLGWLIQWSKAVCRYNKHADQDADLHDAVQQQIDEFVRDAKFEKTKKAFKDFVDNEQSWSALRQMWFVHGGRDLFCRHLTRNGGGGASGPPMLSASSSFVSLGGSMLT
ncbi:unnamed protein product, partial [Amoebophrya sp. A25]|eukprot:GSA25T00027429001.1